MQSKQEFTTMIPTMTTIDVHSIVYYSEFTVYYSEFTVYYLMKATPVRLNTVTNGGA